MTNIDLASNLGPSSESGSATHSARMTQAQRSALWAAYGDALGWISELTDAEGLKRRTGGAPLDKPVKWTRRIGGRRGVTVSLPQGCYSDDSQLRLATCRAIRADGFDVEAFAKVELPVWRAYALGGGRSTSLAASNLAKPRASWFNNTFKGWTKSGGNGAAMRIQPHVWAACSPRDADCFLPDVVRNAICTHSHPTGLIGAVLHALTLAHTFGTGCPPSPDDFLAVTKVAAQLPDMVAGDPEVGSYWLAAFERESGAFDRAWAQAVAESRKVIHIASNGKAKSSGADRYADIVERLSLREPQRRGSGLLTAVAAVSLTWCEASPEEALRIAANTVGTDTDTIATMAGSILGVVADHEPPVKVLDADLFRSEATRLANITYGQKEPNHRYPNLLRWVAPKTQADMLTCTRDGRLRVAGLGPAEAMGDTIASSTEGFAWRWVKLTLGQTLLIKHRKHILTSEDEPATIAHARSNGVVDGESGDMFSMGDAHPSMLTMERKQERAGPLDIQRALQYLEEHMDDDRCVGLALRRVVQKGTATQVLEFLATFCRLVNR